VKQMVTDPNRKLRSDPENPDICNVFTMHKIFSSRTRSPWSIVSAGRAGIGCVECKLALCQEFKHQPGTIQERRNNLAKIPTTCRMCWTMEPGEPGSSLNKHAGSGARRSDCLKRNMRAWKTNSHKVVFRPIPWLKVEYHEVELPMAHHPGLGMD